MSATGRGHVPAAWGTAVLVCGKCSRKVNGGFGPKGRTTLAKALRRRAGKGKPRKLPYGVIETGCLKLCPKNAVVAIDGRRPGDWLLVRPGEPIEAVAARLGLPPGPDQSPSVSGTGSLPEMRRASAVVAS